MHARGGIGRLRDMVPPWLPAGVAGVRPQGIQFASAVALADVTLDDAPTQQLICKRGYHHIPHDVYFLCMQFVYSDGQRL